MRGEYDELILHVLRNALTGKRVKRIEILNPVTDVKLLIELEDDHIVLCCNECGIWMEKLCSKCGNYMYLDGKKMEWICPRCGHIIKDQCSTSSSER